MKTLSQEAQSHVQWNCTYHIVVVPKYRKSVLFQGIRKEIGFLFKELSKRLDFEIIKGNVGPDHIHMIAKIAPKYSIADILGKLKGKSAIIIHNKYGNKKSELVQE
ncbi:MAG: IS200/IS605 family transposase [Candidatus Gracilibacteria bacterium]|nr:IS200/IS605 family transposase [Candidatus Gracilibacteria bacterium]